MNNIMIYQKFLDSKNELTEKLVNGNITISEYNDSMDILNLEILVIIKNTRG